MEDGRMAIGRKATTPLWEVHGKAPEATLASSIRQLNSSGQHKDEARMRECSRALWPEKVKLPTTCAKVVPPLKLSGTNYEHWLVWRNF